MEVNASTVHMYSKYVQKMRKEGMFKQFYLLFNNIKNFHKYKSNLHVLNGQNSDTKVDLAILTFVVIHIEGLGE